MKEDQVLTNTEDVATILHALMGMEFRFAEPAVDVAETVTAAHRECCCSVTQGTTRFEIWAAFGLGRIDVRAALLENGTLVSEALEAAVATRPSLIGLVDVLMKGLRAKANLNHAFEAVRGWARRP